MRISKANHLRQLLQTQDVAIGTLAYVATIDLYWFAGLITRSTALSELYFAPLAVVCCVAASTRQSPRLHSENLIQILQFAARYSILVVAGLILLLYFGQLRLTTTLEMAVFGTLLFVGLTGNRLLLQWWYLRRRTEHPSNYLKILVIGAGSRAQNLMQRYREESEWGIKVIGILDPDAELSGNTVQGVTVLGGVEEIDSVLAEEVVDEVVICLPRSLIGGVGQMVKTCEEEGVCIKFLADVIDVPYDRISYETVGGMPLLNFEPVSQDEWNLIIKRIMDLMFTVPAMVLLLPLFAIAALIIKFDSPGPVFFKQKRVGLNKRDFDIIKFRSMFLDAEERLKDIEHLNEADGPIFKISQDPRITRVGRFMRKFSIDELPQLFNVFLGQMSLVGPRPMSKRDVQLFSRGIQRRRFSVRPGLACLREVSGRSTLSFDRWLELDLQYIDEWSLWLDFKILLKIVPTVLKGDGAS